MQMMIELPQPELAGHAVLLNYEDAAKPDSSDIVTTAFVSRILSTR